MRELEEPGELGLVRLLGERRQLAQLMVRQVTGRYAGQPADEQVAQLLAEGFTQATGIGAALVLIVEHRDDTCRVAVDQRRREHQHPAPIDRPERGRDVCG